MLGRTKEGRGSCARPTSPGAGLRLPGDSAEGRGRRGPVPLGPVAPRTKGRGGGVGLCAGHRGVSLGSGWGAAGARDPGVSEGRGRAGPSPGGVWGVEGAPGSRAATEAGAALEDFISGRRGRVGPPRASLQGQSSAGRPVGLEPSRFDRSGRSPTCWFPQDPRVSALPPVLCTRFCLRFLPVPRGSWRAGRTDSLRFSRKKGAYSCVDF